MQRSSPTGSSPANLRGTYQRLAQLELLARDPIAVAITLPILIVDPSISREIGHRLGAAANLVSGTALANAMRIDNVDGFAVGERSAIIRSGNRYGARNK
jgi:hypothetical protein